MLDLVLLPGMNCTEDLWTHCGLKGPVITPRLEVSDVDSQVAHLLNILPDRFVLGGLSLGAIVAMSVALRAPDRVAGLVLAATNASAPTQAQRNGWQNQLDALNQGQRPVDLQRGILSLLFSESGLRDASLAERALAQAEVVGPNLSRQLRLQATRSNLLEHLGTLTVPTLVLAGSQDAICPVEFHQSIVDAMPEAEMSIIDAGHLMSMEQPKEFGRRVNGWRRAHDL